MRRAKFSGDFRIIVMLLVLCCFSCNKDDDYPPYLGRWMTTKGIPVANGYAGVDYYLELSDNRFTESFVDYDQRQEIYYPKYVSIKGSFSVAADVITFIPEEISYSTYDANTDTHSEPYAVYTKENENIRKMMSEFILAMAGRHAQYTVTGDKLKLRVDNNWNDDFSDDGRADSYDRL